jgi:hypothetical protein
MPLILRFPGPLVRTQAKGQEALLGSLTKNVGTAIGLELRDSTQQLSATNSKPVQAGMTFNVAVGGQARVGQLCSARLGSAPCLQVWRVCAAAY